MQRINYISADEPDNVDKPWQRRAGTSIDEMYGYIRRAVPNLG